MRVMTSFALACISLANLSAQTFEFQTRKAADAVGLVKEGESTIVEVFSSDGIGSATITPTGGKWPRVLTLRFNLRNLEFIRVSRGGTTIHGRLGGNRWTMGASEKETWPANIRKSGASILVDIPEAITRGDLTPIHIEWINEYRR